MFISPRKVIEQGWLKFPDWMTDEQKEKCIQPNAIDFTVDRLFQIIASPDAFISEETRLWHDQCEMEGSTFCLQHNGLYDGMSDFYVTVPEQVACMLVNRSSLNRLGIHLNSGIYDSGFKGQMGFSLHNRVGNVALARHTRVGQIIFIESDSVGQYAGGFNTEQGKHWKEGR